MQFTQPLPKTQLLRRDTTMDVRSKSVNGLRIRGYHGPYTLYVQGTYAAAAPTTGAQTGTAGAGTTSTSLVKPTSAANWTSSNLVGKFVRILSGGGAPGASVRIPVIRQILANTTTTLTIKAVAGLDTTSTFDIVECDTVINAFTANVDDIPTAQGGKATCIDVSDNTCRVVFIGFKFTSGTPHYNVYSRRNQDVRFYGCDFGADPLTDTVSSDDDTAFAIYDSKLSAGASVAVQNARRATVDRCYATAASGVSIDYTHTVVAGLTATASTGNTLTVKRANNVAVDMAASSCAATPAVFETCQRVDITALTGTSNTGYGVDVSKGGVYNLTGATITGSTGDFIIDGVANAAITWSEASNYGAHTRWGNTLLLTGGANTTRYMDNARFEGNIDITASGYVSGSGGTVQSGGRFINYGFFHLAADAAFDNLTAHAGGGQGPATALGYGSNRIGTCATSNDSCILPSGALIGGVPVFVFNAGAATAAIFPRSGGQIDALGTNNAITLAAGKGLWLMSRSDGTSWDSLKGA